MSAALAPSEHRPDQALVLAARAAVRALGRDYHAAEELLGQALKLVPVEMLNLRADVLADLAAVLGHSAHPAEAAATHREAIEMYERKGNLAAAANAGRPAPG